MDISLLSTFKEHITTQYNEMVVSMLEQYKAELEDLNKMLLNVSTIIKEKESLVEELQAQVEDNKFNESNFNNVSIIQNLNKQIGDLTNQNEILATSLRIRKNTTPTEPVVVTEQKVELVVSEVEEVVEVVEEVEEEEEEISSLSSSSLSRPDSNSVFIAKCFLWLFSISSVASVDCH